eukprot:5706958-Pyramimonas_sp.AAC.1
MNAGVGTEGLLELVFSTGHKATEIREFFLRDARHLACHRKGAVRWRAWISAIGFQMWATWGAQECWPQRWHRFYVDA